MGPKVWFRLNGVPVAWRPLPAAAAARRLPEAGLAGPGERLLVLAPIGSGLHLAELLRLRVGRPRLAGRRRPAAPRAGGRAAGRPLPPASRPAGRADHLPVVPGQGGGPGRPGAAPPAPGSTPAPEAPLVAGPDGRPAGRATVARRPPSAANAIIRAGSNVNVDLCRKTGEFFREWGLPGSRFTPVPELAATSIPEGGEQA